MLSIAKQKNVYDKLTHSDITEYLSSMPLGFDYYIALDVFIYVGELDEIFRLIKSGNKKPGQAGDDDYLKLSEKKKGMVYGSGIGAAVGADQARRYLRDVKLRHKQLKLGGAMETLPDSYKQKHKDWLRGHTGGKLGKRKKVGLYSKSAPKGFRRHVATRSLAKILTPIAVAGGIGYGIDKQRRRSSGKA